MSHDSIVRNWQKHSERNEDKNYLFLRSLKFRDYGFDVDEVAGALHEEVADAHHSTEDQLLAKARELYAEFNRK